MMATAQATWVTHLYCTCVECQQFVDLMTEDDFWSDKQDISPGDCCTEKTNNLPVWCPMCGYAFTVECNW